MKVPLYDAGGRQAGQVQVPAVFEMQVRRDLVHKAYVNLDSHRYQPQGRHPTAGMDVVARSDDPPTGRGVSRIAKMRGGGGGRQGQAGGVASVRGGRQAHPPRSNKVVWKRLNKKENKMALCSAIAYTADADQVRRRGHRIGPQVQLPIILQDEIESVDTAKRLIDTLKELDIFGDVERLQPRPARSGKSALRGRPKKAGRSVLFVVGDASILKRACGSIPGVEAVSARNLSVLQMAPGAQPGRLTLYSEAALQHISKIYCARLDIQGRLQ